jgi:Pvc16 N-terminal domain
MIQDLDSSIKELLQQKVPLDPSSVDISFDMPTKEWAAGLLKPTINVFLYDLRENRELRRSEPFRERSSETTATETRPPMRVDLTYLVTAWANEVSDEHQLLGRLLTALVRYPVLPTEVLKGAMQNQSYPVLAWIALPERTPHAWDFWGILENRLKAGISYVVTASVEPFAPEVFGPLVTKTILNLHDGVGT